MDARGTPARHNLRRRGWCFGGLPGGLILGMAAGKQNKGDRHDREAGMRPPPDLDPRPILPVHGIALSIWCRHVASLLLPLYVDQGESDRSTRYLSTTTEPSCDRHKTVPILVRDHRYNMKRALNAAASTRRVAILTAALALVLLIAWADRQVHAQVPLGLLYLLPIALASTVLRRWEVAVLAVLCTATAEFSDAFSWSWGQGIARDLLYLAAYAAIGLYVSEALAKRRVERLHLQAVEAEAEARRSAEEQLRLLIASSPVAIVTSDESGDILEANEAAERIFWSEEETNEEEPAQTPRGRRIATGRLTGQPLLAFLPSLARVSPHRAGQPPLRTMMQCQGARANGERFLADVWFSTYETTPGARITAMVVDTSEDVRDREEANLEQVLEGSRLLIGAVSHEIRNVCAAIGLVQGNLQARMPGLRAEPDFQALQQLTAALERMASVELSQVKRQPAELDLARFFHDLRIIVASSLRSAGVALRWEIEPAMPSVQAEAQTLMQVFLNLLRNAETALNDVNRPVVTITSTLQEATIAIRVSDNGPGVLHPELLFRPFASGSRRSGFGLYLSRAMMNAVRGDLRYEPTAAGAVFVVELALVKNRSEDRDTTPLPSPASSHRMLTRSQ